MSGEGGTKVLVATRLSPAERTRLVRLAERNDRPISREIRRAILRHLEQESTRAGSEEAGEA